MRRRSSCASRCPGLPGRFHFRSRNKGYALSMLPKEIWSVYPAVSSPTLSASAATRAWNALELLQTVAAHPETRTPFLEAGIPLYLFPFLNTTSEAKSLEYLRASSLGVHSALTKVDDAEVVKFLLKSEVTQIMGTGSELSETVATFIVQKIMLDEVGLQRIRAAPECFFQAASVLASMVMALTEQPSTKMLKLIIGCYLRLTDDPRAILRYELTSLRLRETGHSTTALWTTLLQCILLTNFWVIWLVLPAEPRSCGRHKP